MNPEFGMRTHLRCVNLTLFALILVHLLAERASAQDNANTSKCECPAFAVRSVSTEIRRGEIAEFSIVTSDEKVRERRFRWSVSKGEIAYGEGTSKIGVRIPLPTPPKIEASPSSPPELPPGFVPSSEPTSWLFSGNFVSPRNSLTVRAELMDKAGCNCAASKSFTIVSSEVVNHVADVTGLRLSAKSLVAPCEPGREPAAGVTVSKSMIIDVETSAKDPEDDVLTYSYTVSGGRVIGMGANVKWDLTGVAPGTYTITAGVDDGCGICGKTLTEEVTIAECTAACGLVTCPTIDLRAPEALENESIFTANVSGGGQASVTFTWAVTDGEILSGQGTPEIRAKLSRHGSVTLKVGNLDPKGNCPDSITKEYTDGRLKP